MRWSGRFQPGALVPDARVRALSRAAGWAVALVAAAGLLGALLARPFLLQPSPWFPALTTTAAVGVLALGLGLAGLGLDQRRGVRLSGLAALGLGLLALIPELIPRDRLAVSSALLLVAGGVGLLTASTGGRADRGRLAAGVAGAIAVVFCLGILLTRVVRNPDVPGGLLVGSSLQVLVAALLLGLCLVLIAWSADHGTASAPWVPLSVGAASLLTVVFLWRTLITYEREQIREQTVVAGQSARREVFRQLESATRALDRIARFSPRPPPAAAAWRSNFLALTRDIDGLLGIGWTAPDGSLLELEPRPVATPELAQNLADGLEGVPPADSTRPAYFTFTTDPNRFAVAVPVCDADRCAGRVAGVFDAARMLLPVLGDSAQGFFFRVTSERRDIVSPPGRLTSPPAWTEHAAVSTDRLRWDLAVWPTDLALARWRSGLPDLLLLLGLLVTALLPVTIRLAQLNWTRARLAERVRLNLALETATDGIWEWDVASTVARRSAALWRHLGYDPETMDRGGDSWAGLIHPADERQVRAAMSDHLAGLTESYEARYRIRGAAGEWHWVIDRGRVVERSPAGAPLRVLGISADITERIRADQALEASERRFRACFDSAYQFQALLDLDGRVLEANRTALDVAGASLDQVRGRPLWDAPWWGGDGPAGPVRAACRDARAGHTVRTELEFEVDGGRPVTWDFSLSPLLDGEGRVIQLLAEGRDITLRRRAEQVLRETESLTTMGRLAARVAHEINNPLAGIQNAFRLIKDAVPADHPHRNYVGSIEREIGRIAAVTRQLYETYRPDGEGSGRASVSSLVGDAVALLEQVNRGTGVRIAVDLAGVPATVRLPDSILRQAVYNLVQNAVEASPEGGVVTLSAAVEDTTLVLRVRDQGAGVPAELRERIFEPFFTTKSAGVRTGGMGLGLSLVRRSVVALGGQIGILDPPDGGTEFVVRLPLPPVESGDLS